MSLVPVCLDAIEDGDLTKRISEALRRAQKDMIERPSVGKPRVVTISVSMTPSVDDLGLVRADIGSKIKTTLPPKTGRKISAILKDDQFMVNHNMFNDGSEPEQPRLMEL